MDNILSNISDSITVRTSILSGVLKINSYLDDVEGEAVGKGLSREFRYSIDTINFSEWVSITDITLQAIILDPNHELIVEFRYVRIGSDNSGDIVFKSNNISTITIADIVSDVLNDSVFSQFITSFCDTESREWRSNVLNKVYQKGLIMNALTRNQNENDEDRDYIDFWRAVICFYSLFVVHIRGFENFNEDKELLQLYVQMKGLITRPDQQLEVSQYLMENLFRGFRERGSLAMFVEGDDVDGELLRLIDYDSRSDEFLYAINNPKTIGWVMDVNSPLNKYIHDQPYLHKLYKDTIPMIADSYIEVGTFREFDNVIKISGVPDGVVSGVGVSEFSEEFSTNVNSTLPYELAFWASGDAAFNVKINGYNQSGQQVSVRSINPSNQSEFAIRKARVINGELWYFVSVIIHPYTEVYVESDDIRLPSIGSGSNLIWPINVSKADIQITIDRNSSIGINNAPLVDDNSVTINKGEIYTITIGDLTKNYFDAEGDVFAGVIINGIDRGALLFNNVEVASYPITVSKQDINLGYLQYQDNPNNLAIANVNIDYVVVDEVNESIDGAELYLRDISFKLLRTDYGKGLVGGQLFTELWLQDNSGRDEDQIENSVRDYMIPYKMGFYINFLRDILNFNNEVSVSGLYEDTYEDTYE